MTALPEASRKRLPTTFLGAVLACVVTLLLIMGVGHSLEGAEQRTVFADINSPIVDFMAGLCLLAAALQTARHSKRLAIAWGILTFAQFLYAAGDAAWSMLEVVLHQAPFPSIADAFYLAYYPVFLAGVVLLLRTPDRTNERINDILDLAVILTAAILGFWNFLIGPILRANSGATALEQLILAAYPVVDLVMLGGLLLIIYNDPAPAAEAGKSAFSRGLQQPLIPALLLAAGMLIMILTDCVYSYRSVLGTYVSGGMLDLGWIIANLLIGLAGVAQWCAMQPGNLIADYEAAPAFRIWLLRVKTYLPYVWLVGAFVLLVVGATGKLPMRFGFIAIGVGLILGLVLIRQFITLSENQRLTDRLREQTANLESVNRELNEEIAERVRVQEKLAFDVLHDQMTGLANRRLFLDRLGQAIKRCRRHAGVCFGVLFLDLDQFKVVNDSLGHASGDQLLILVGRRLVENLRAGDTVARFGGDEFAILLDDLDDEDTARAIAEKVLHVIEQPFYVSGRDMHISASIGIATNAIQYEYPEDLLRDVDLAMYQAKAGGKGRCVMFRGEMRDQAFSRLALEDELRGALRNNEFRLFYQPISSLESDEIVAVEALLRWLHPVRGLLPPADFLTVAEESDLILQIGDWVLHQACLQLRTWQEQYPQLSQLAVNINISNREFAQPHLAGKIFRALEVSGLDGSCLRLEITERVLVENYPTANAAIAALNEMGVRVEIDDFGTGYSALAYLQQFPINAIKIDKSFINDMRKNRKGLGLVRAIVSMARELGMETIAEGIETGEQLSELKGLLCGFGQGYLLSRPLDAAGTESILARRLP